ncbi:hypothetical protein DO97_05845 [Neosynechococcus sphagnicola sy1]|uniref:Uncharacterized protein n=1 Tax=Neosynechococcus sphagnicola sy1 TaxID=1497020 RepID=A0A098TPS4_9CYAN|nr:hypothetical protein [Neosynechococcus sphagnicola]KGF73882.1 hypothetical protein DO97_05845 [Neosynechococcus sphagnicola sy1]
MQEESPIWPPYEAFYIQSMLFNSASAVRSILRLEAIFGKLPERPTAEDVDGLPTRIVLNELQNMVVQAGALSRYFWPVRPEYKSRGQVLRQCFAMTDESPLFNRDLRNAIEHFDERIDKYFARGAVGCFFPEYVGARPADDGVPGHFFRAYFVDTGEFRLLDEDFAMKPLADEVLFVQAHLELMDTEGGRFQPAKRDA